MPFEFQGLAIPGVVLVKARRFEDNRGYFRETYRSSDFGRNGIPDTFVQDNLSYSVARVLRGLHYQKNPQAQGKLVEALLGRVFDVAVDIRIGSPTYRQWVAIELAADNGHMLYVPPGFAHGFCVLSGEAIVAYKATQEYAPELDRGIRWDDPEIGVEWPISEPLLSPKDAALPLLREADNDFLFKSL
jgi:dTDP-4-dehydrorhamnose 3,5-epimerase